MPRAPLAAVLLLVIGCRINREPIDARHAQRVAQIHARYNELQRQNDAAWFALFAQLEPWRQMAVPVDAQGVPTERLYVAFQRAVMACAELKDNHACQACMNAASDEHESALQRRYFLADWSWARAEHDRTSADLETLLATSHNARLAAAISAGEAPLREGLLQQRADLERWRALELELATEERDSEIREAEAALRRRLSAVAQGLQAVGQGLQRASTSQPAAAAASTYQPPAVTPASTYTPATVTPTSTTAWASPPARSSGCSSDFQCGVGNVCVKQNFSSSGVCMRAVNEYGTPTYQLPALDSVGPKMPSAADCHFMTDCPIGFRCDAASGTCIRNQ